MNTPAPLHCVNHPETETYLRCNRCERPICPACATSTPTGYRCPDCVRAQQKVFETALRRDYPTGFLLAAILSGAGNYLASLLDIWGLLAAFLVAYAIAELVRKATARRRSEALFRTVAAGALLGTMPFAAISLIAVLILPTSPRGLAPGFLYFILWQAAYTLIVTLGTYRRLKGIIL